MKEQDKDELIRVVSTVVTWHCNYPKEHKDDLRFRKSPLAGLQLPYAGHPLEVMKKIWSWEIGDLILLKSAAGHDLREDTEIPESIVVAVFGKEAADVIEELTFYGDTPEEKALYMESFEFKSIRALVCKMADRLVNVVDWALVDEKYAAKYYRKSQPLFDAFVDRQEEIAKTYSGEILINIWYDAGKVAKLVDERPFSLAV